MIEIREISTPDAIKQIAAVEAAAWGADLARTVPNHMHQALYHAGGNLLGAYDGERLVGFTQAYPTNRRDPYWLWSHMVGVYPDYQGRGIGRRLKFAQRDWALTNGFQVMGWTFDPLQRGNANLNLRQLGGVVETYLLDFYGELNDTLNRGIPTDRLELRWNLQSERVVQLADGVDEVQAQYSNSPIPQFILRVGRQQEPVIDLEHVDDTCLVEIPYDIQLMKRQKLSLAKEWRFALRQVMQKLFDQGYTVVDFETQDKRCWYVVSA